MAEPSLRALCQAVADATARRDAPGTDFGDRYRAMRARAAARVALIEFMQADDSADIAIAEFAAAEARTAWQPIETAPVGEWVLVYNPRPYVSKGDVGAGITRDGRSWSRGNSESWWNPTHWMPLPAAPEAP